MISPLRILTTHKLFIQKLRKPLLLQLADGSQAQAGAVYEKALLDFKTRRHAERASCYLTKLNPSVPIILGLEWLRIHDPSISWAKNTVTFDSDFCHHHCLPNGRPITVTGLTKEAEKAFHQPDSTQTNTYAIKARGEEAQSPRSPQSVQTNAVSARSTSSAHESAHESASLVKEKPKSWSPARMVGGKRLPQRRQKRHSHSHLTDDSPVLEEQVDPENLDIKFVAAAPFLHFAKRKGVRVHRIDPRRLDLYKSPSEDPSEQDHRGGYRQIPKRQGSHDERRHPEEAPA